MSFGDMDKGVLRTGTEMTGFYRIALEGESSRGFGIYKGYFLGTCGYDHSLFDGTGNGGER